MVKCHNILSLLGRWFRVFGMIFALSLSLSLLTPLINYLYQPASANAMGLECAFEPIKVR